MRGKVRKTIKTTTIHALQIHKDPSTGNYTTTPLPTITVNGKVTENKANKIVADHPQYKEGATIIIDNIVEGKTTYEMDVVAFMAGANIVQG